MAEAPGGPAALGRSRLLPALIVGQLGLHAAMAGLRMAMPLQALRLGASAWTVGLLLALFAAAPVLMALPAGRLADRWGYHRPVRIAAALALAGMGCALASVGLDGGSTYVALCLAASLTGSAANLGLLTIQRNAGLAARDGTERMRMFSWLGIAPSFSNVVGPVAAGLMIDGTGFAGAYLLLMALPLATLASARLVPRLPPPGASLRGSGRSWDLLAQPGLLRLLAVNWLFSTGWDVHSFTVPLLGHERGFSASTIGFILGSFTLSVTAVRLLVPVLAHRIDEVKVLSAAMLLAAAVFAVYPLAATPWLMGACAVILGLALGVAQPLIMTALHHLTPDGRHGESLALRSMTINASSTLMPLVFGALGNAAGAAALFWGVALAMAGGSSVARRLASYRDREPPAGS